MFCFFSFFRVYLCSFPPLNVLFQIAASPRTNPAARASSLGTAVANAAPAVDEEVEGAVVPPIALVVTVGGVSFVSVLVLTRLHVIVVGWLRLSVVDSVELAPLEPGVRGSVVIGMMTLSSVTWPPEAVVVVVAAAKPGRKLGV